MADFRGARNGEPLEARIARLEDIESIRQLKHQYSVYCDHGYDADGMTSLFTEDAVWDSNKFGTYEGRDAIHGFIKEVGKEILFALHYMNNELIEIAPDGQTARGSWILLEPATMTRADSDENDSVIITAEYDDEFVKVDGEWKFKRVKANFRTVANLHEGWHKRPYRDE